MASRKSIRGKESGEYHQSGTHIHHDLIMEILERLPAKSVGRCRCVSRLWRSSLTDPGFIHKHAMKASENPSKINEKLFCLVRDKNLLLKVTPETYCDDEHSSIDNIIEEAAEKLVLPKKVPLHPRYRISVDTCSIVGSCHGICCLRYHDYMNETNFLLLNFVTGESRVIDYQQGADDNRVYGFGYDSSTKDYKIVSFQCPDPGYFRKPCPKHPYVVDVLSLRNSCWRSIVQTPPMVPACPYLLSTATCVELNGFLHWQHCGKGCAKGWSDSIFTFDLAEEKCGEIIFNAPNKGKKNEYYDIIGLGVLNGCLYVNMRSMPRSEGCDIWVMKEYGVQQSWTKLMLVSFSPRFLANSFVNLFPVYYTKKGRLILFLPQHDVYNVQQYSFSYSYRQYRIRSEKGKLLWFITADVDTLLSPNSLCSNL
ncbi:hypothetical protein COLO4_10034 [Corchorus olitorius]|uniref:F-box domain-containing protein n=1 Tax=Corchorus olitorius TaxID=93759 RepID=A0A1R3KAE0_9ROSI|nr:hypothetical protein COLO4_10034 [Corchorus olitorius]